MTTRIWTVMEMVRWTADYLDGKGVREPRLNGELLLADVLGVKRLDLYLQFDRPLRPEELAEFKTRLKRRASHEPLQYIAGHADFRDLRLRVDRRVLIPRPETELLVGEALRWAEGRPGLEALDLGTGSGAIALSLGAEGHFGRIVATDRSEEALEVARANHEAVAAGAPVEFRWGDLFGPVAGERFDLIVSNPPYVGEEQRGALDREVRDFEPAQALFAGPGGLDVLRRLIAGAPGHLREGGLLALEIGAEQGAAVRALVEATPELHDFRLVRDLSGRDRIALAHRVAG